MSICNEFEGLGTDCHCILEDIKHDSLNSCKSTKCDFWQLALLT